MNDVFDDLFGGSSKDSYALYDDAAVGTSEYFEPSQHTEICRQDRPTSVTPFVSPPPELAIEIPRPVLQNVIASVNLSTTIDLRRVAISARNAEYNPTKVNAVVKCIFSDSPSDGATRPLCCVTSAIFLRISPAA